jgi:hypothetical protein
MLHEIFERKNIDPDPLDEHSPIMKTFGQRIICQWGALQFLIHFLFRAIPKRLVKQPVKVPSGKYDESLRVERPQHDLVTDMVLELTRLPRFTAYAKIIQEEKNKQTVKIYKMQTHPLPDIKNSNGELQAIANAQRLCKTRDQIDEEIRTRQRKWQDGQNRRLPEADGNDIETLSETYLKEFLLYIYSAKLDTC